jgi:Fic family protein
MTDSSAAAKTQVPPTLKSRMTADRLLPAIAAASVRGAGISVTELSTLDGASTATIKRHLALLLHEKKIVRIGQARATRYLATTAGASAAAAEQAPPDLPFPLTAQSRALRQIIAQPLAMRTPVSYRRSFIDSYEPNHSSLLPPQLAADLARKGAMPGQQPAGTYARKVLESLLIDLSWSSSRLEGNRYTLLDTEDLFARGAVNGDTDAVMLLNHKEAIEFMVDAVPEYGLGCGVVSNIHAILMRDLLIDSASLGTIRRKVVNISGTVYTPLQMPAQLAELYALVLEKAQRIKNPVESAFFLWVHLAYLQPFEDGNKRTSRLASNVPLMLYNCAPLSFMDVGLDDYAQAMIGVYERCDVALAVDLFAWTYRRSMDKYKAVLASMEAPDPVRLRHREDLNQAIVQVVLQRQTVAQAEALLKLDASLFPAFHALLTAELRQLGPHNGGRYRIAPRIVDAWIEDGRPQ